MSTFEHIPHPWIRQRATVRPPKVDDERVGIGGRVGASITAIVGTMTCALAFAILAFISFPAAIHTGDLIIIVAWIAQTFLQLVLLPIIIVGQNVLGKAADKRASLTYKDAEAILSECLQLQDHLMAQDKVLHELIAQVKGLMPGSGGGAAASG
jgi:hypothetical protein